MIFAALAKKRSARERGGQFPGLDRLAGLARTVRGTQEQIEAAYRVLGKGRFSPAGVPEIRGRGAVWRSLESQRRFKQLVELSRKREGSLIKEFEVNGVKINPVEVKQMLFQEMIKGTVNSLDDVRRFMIGMNACAGEAHFKRIMDNLFNKTELKYMLTVFGKKELIPRLEPWYLHNIAFVAKQSKN